MTEVSFAKQYLATLDLQPIRIPSDHVEDPRQLPAGPAYILPKMPRPMSKRQILAPGQEPSVNIVLKSLRNPPLDITLPGQPVSTGLLNLKHAVAERANIPVDKLRLLYKKKPCSDAKTIKDLVPAGEKDVEFSVMVIGGVAAPPAPVPAGSTAAVSPEQVKDSANAPTNGNEVLGTEAFWQDLNRFLEPRLTDQAQRENVARVFRDAWARQAST